MARAKRLGEIYVEINARLDKFEKDLKKARMGSERSQKKMQRTFDKVNFNKARNSLMRFNTLLATVAGGYALKQIAGHALETAANFEQMEVKLNQLTGGRGRETLKELNEWAIKMPVNTMEAVDAFVMMQAMGLDPTIKKMQILTDVGSILGDDVLKRVALQLGQTAAMGKIMGQEIRVLGEAGINARKYLMDAFGMTVQQVQKSGMNIKIVLKAIFDGMEKDFGGASEKMMKSWRGLKVTFQSYVMELERRVMGAGVFDALKQHLDEINIRLWDWIENNQALINQKVPEYVERFTSALRGLVGWYVKHNMDIQKAMDSVNAFGEAMNRAFGGAGKTAQMWIEQTSDAVDRYQHETERLRRMNVTTPEGLPAITNLFEEGPFNPAMLEAQKEFDAGMKAFNKTLAKTAELGGAIEETAKAYQARLKRYASARADDLDILGVGLWNAEPPEGAIDAYIEKIERYVEARGEEMDALGVGLWIPEKEEVDEAFKGWIELSERTAWAMQDNFSNLFYDAVKGELKSFEDYMSSIFDSILRAWSDLMGQMITQWIFGDITSAGGGGGLMGWIGGLFDGGATPGFDMSPYARGGVINKPTIFPFASGMALAGESGSEAILPLGRTQSGDLGVKSSGESTVVNNYISAMDAQSFYEYTEKNSAAIVNPIIKHFERGDRGLIGAVKEVIQ